MPQSLPLPTEGVQDTVGGVESRVQEHPRASILILWVGWEGGGQAFFRIYGEISSQ